MAEQENAAARELTWGEKQAGWGFNPSKDKVVDEIKRSFADLFDKLNDLREASDNPDARRFYSMSITNMNDAQMEAVKAATWRH